MQELLDLSISEEKDMGPQMVSGKPRVFKPARSHRRADADPGKPGTILATVKVANTGPISTCI
jgi:hypothetical protein